MSTIWNDNAARFATTADQATTAARHEGVRTALEHIVHGDHRRGHATLIRSVERQARLAGIGRVHLHPATREDPS